MPRIRLSIRSKFIFSFALIVLTPLTIASLHNYTTMKNRLNNSLSIKTTEASSDTINQLVQYTQSATRKADLASELVLTAIKKGHSEVQNILYMKQDLWENAIVEVFNANGQLIARSYDGEPSSRPFFTPHDSSLIQETLSLTKKSGFYSEPSGMVIRATCPVVEATDLSSLGCVITSYPINDQLLLAIKAYTKQDIIAVTQDFHKYGSTLDEATTTQNIQELKNHIASPGSTQNGLLNLQDNIIFHRAIRNNENVTLGHVIAVTSKETLNNEIEAYLKSIAVEATILSLGTIIILFITTRTLTKPIYTLREAIANITYGKSSHQVNVQQDDEIGELAASFNEMSSRLHIKHKKLISAEEKYRRFFEDALEGILQINDQHAIINCNLSAAQMFGYSTPTQLMNRVNNAITELFVNEADGEKLFASASKAKQIRSFEAIMKRRDGSSFPALLSMRTTPASHNSPRLFESSIFDLSAKMEKEQAESARKEAEQANEFKSQFLANMSHEIRTPLNAIIGMSGVLKHTKLDGKQKEFVGIIDAASRNLLYVVNEVLDFSKIEAGKMEIECELFDFEDMIEDIISLFTEQLAQKEIEFIADIANDIPPLLYSDQFRLRQVITNLCSNAFKFTSRGEILLKASVKERFNNSIELLFEVSDTGIGIPPHKQDSLFDAFTQADSSITRQYGGTGLGLSISQEIVAMLGGEMWLASENDRGSSFYFTCLARQDKSDSTDACQKETLEGIMIAPCIDNKQLSFVVQRMLNQHGATTIPCRKDAPQFEELRNTSDGGQKLLLLDSALGLQTCKHILHQYFELIPDGKAIMLTPYGNSNYQFNDTEHHAVHLLTKPVRKTALIERILTITGRLNALPISKKEDGHWMNGKRILLVEDNEFNQLVAIEIFNEYKAYVTLADNGKVAVDLLNKNASFDLVLMDVQMPIMDGYEATEIIRQELGSSIPIVAMTAHAATSDRDKCIKKGMNAYLSKPIDRTKLEQVLKGVLLH